MRRGRRDSFSMETLLQGSDIPESVHEVTREAETQSIITVNAALTSSSVGGVSPSIAKRLFVRSNSSSQQL